MENLTLLDEIDFQFNIIVTETKITNSIENGSCSCIPGYQVFDFEPTTLASGGLFIHESLSCTILEGISNEAFQALWIETYFVNNKNIIFDIIYRQHNSPDQFMSYFNVTIEKLTSLNINVLITDDFNIYFIAKHLQLAMTS